MNGRSTADSIAQQVLANQGDFQVRLVALYRFTSLRKEVELECMLPVLQREALGFTSTWAKKLISVKRLTGHEGCVNRLAWSEDGSFLASGSDDKQVGSLYLCTDQASPE